MDVDYYLVSDEHKELYSLDRGFWYECGTRPSLDELMAFNHDATPGEGDM